MQLIQTIFGSEPFLTQFVKQHPTLMLLKPGGHDQDFAVLDMTGQVHFTNPLQYTAELSSGEIKDKSFLQFMYFNLNSEDEAVFLAKVRTLFDHQDIFPGIQSLVLAKAHGKAIQYLLLSSWDDGHQFFALKNTPAFQPLLELSQRAAASNGYHEAGYTRVFPK